MALLACATVGLASDVTPAAKPVAGEVFNHTEQSIRRQFAPPVAVGDGSVLLFSEEGGEPKIWRVFPLEPARSTSATVGTFRVPYGQHIGYSEQRAALHASVATPAGVWLVGPSIELLRPNGQWLTGKIHWPRNAPNVVALHDGSIMVVGGGSWPTARDGSTSLKVERAWLDERGQIKTEVLPPLPVDISGTGVWESVWGYALAHLGQGRVLLAGSEYRNLSLVYDPAQRAWRKLTGMKAARTDPALVVLPDGRVWATGGTGFAKGDAPSTSELWSPTTQQWTLGPALPVPMVGHRAVLAHDGASVLLAGGYVPTVLAWKPDQALVGLAAVHGMQRQGAGLVPLPGRRLGLVSGIRSRGYNEAWGQRSEGASVVSLDSAMSGNRAPVWPLALHGAMAERRGQLLTASGEFAHGYGGSAQTLPSRLLELSDLATGRVTSRQPLPFSARQAQATWQGDHHALIHGETAEGTQWLVRVNTATGAAQPVVIPPKSTYAKSDGVHNRMRLIGADADKSWLVSDTAAVYWVDAPASSTRDGPRLQRQRTGFVGRVLADGRAVVAGGQVEAELVAARVEDCAVCPVRYIGFGPLLPSRRHELFDPVSQQWLASNPSRAAGGSAAIFADGRVAKLGSLPDRANPGNETPTLELSDASGSQWQTLAWPAGPWQSGSYGEHGAVLTAIHDGPDLQDALFVGTYGPNGNRQWWWTPSVSSTPLTWRALGESVHPHAFPTGEHATGLSNASGLPLFFVGGSAGVVVYTKAR
jgi:hypothetical protein